MSQSDSAYSKVTDRILEALESADPTSWSRPWACPGVARNAFSDRSYSGGNAVVLGLYGFLAGYTDPRWATFQQIKKAGGTVTKGARGWPILLYKRVAKPADGESAGDDDGGYFLVRHFTVFNVAGQSTGIELPTTVVRTHTPTEAEQILLHSGAEFRAAERACYRPGTDEVFLPSPEAFFTADAYYSVAFHELAHWTGAPHRLDRDHTGTFGSPAYAKEELIAELSSAMVASRFGIDYTAENANYIAGWLRPLGNDPKQLIAITRDAAKAADYLYQRAFPDSATDRPDELDGAPQGVAA